jgi:hypothetical protein
MSGMGSTMRYYFILSIIIFAALTLFGVFSGQFF